MDAGMSFSNSKSSEKMATVTLRRRHLPRTIRQAGPDKKSIQSPFTAAFKVASKVFSR